MDRREFSQLLTHMEWADAQTWRAIRSTPDAAADRPSSIVWAGKPAPEWAPENAGH